MVTVLEAVAAVAALLLIEEEEAEAPFPERLGFAHCYLLQLGERWELHC